MTAVKNSLIILNQNSACDRAYNLTVDIGLALSMPHITQKQTVINHIILGDNSRKVFIDNIEPATITYVMEEKF